MLVPSLLVPNQAFSANKTKLNQFYRRVLPRLTSSVVIKNLLPNPFSASQSRQHPLAYLEVLVVNNNRLSSNHKNLHYLDLQLNLQGHFLVEALNLLQVVKYCLDRLNQQAAQFLEQLQPSNQPNNHSLEET